MFGLTISLDFSRKLNDFIFKHSLSCMSVIVKTTFVKPFETFRYLRMPLGLKNTPRTFQRPIYQARWGLSEILILKHNATNHFKVPYSWGDPI